MAFFIFNSEEKEVKKKRAKQHNTLTGERAAHIVLLRDLQEKYNKMTKVSRVFWSIVDPENKRSEGSRRNYIYCLRHKYLPGFEENLAELRERVGKLDI